MVSAFVLFIVPLTFVIILCIILLLCKASCWQLVNMQIVAAPSDFTVSCSESRRLLNHYWVLQSSVCSLPLSLGLYFPHGTYLQWIVFCTVGLDHLTLRDTQTQNRWKLNKEQKPFIFLPFVIIDKCLLHCNWKEKQNKSTLHCLSLGNHVGCFFVQNVKK